MYYNLMEYQKKAETFTNATGKTIPRIFVELQYKVPGKTYSKLPPQHNKNHSLFQYVKELVTFFLSTKLKSFLSTILKPKRTLQSVYGEQSLAILANSVDLEEALIKGLHYNIPIIQVMILSEQGQKIMKSKVLQSFTISHFINQNFVLYGDWQRRAEILQFMPESIIVEGQTQNVEGMYFRRGEFIYGFLSLQAIQKAEQQIIQQNLTKLRNIYFSYNDNLNSTISNVSPQQSQAFSASSSMFQGRPRSGIQDNFNDSDEEQFQNQQFRG